MKYAFRCRRCGHLLSSSQIGPLVTTPYSCPCCGGGVVWHAPAIRSFDPANWEILADAPPERLDEIGLTSEEVERHIVDRAIDSLEKPKHLQRSAKDKPGSKDK